jgi:DNA repair photolyase
MEYKVIHSDSIMKKITKKDSLFHGDYCVDPYQNCEFGCRYCDSSAEKTIYVRGDITEILTKELATIKNRRIILGSVHDPYQPAEKKFEVTKTILELLQQFNVSCHILTKSPLILRDISLLKELDCMVTVSLCSLNEQVIKIFEPDVPLPTQRLHTIETLRKHNIFAGAALIPMLPYIVEPELDDIVNKIHTAHAQYLLHKHLELKGDQERLFRDLIEAHYPHLLPKYDELYENNFNPSPHYVKDINATLSTYCKKYKIADKISLEHSKK